MSPAKKYQKLVDKLFLSFEAIMHIYLVIYLTMIGANVPVILFTAFELSMFLRLLWNGDSEKDLHRYH